MAQGNKKRLNGIERLRLAVTLYSNCSETFNQRFTTAELLTLFELYRRSGWDIPPDRWTDRQVDEALMLGRAPTWDDGEKPTYAETGS